MAFELKVLLESALIPGGVTLVFAGIAWLMAPRISSTWVAGLLAMGWWLGLVVGQCSIVTWSWWSDEHWQRAIWPLLAMGLILGPSALCCKQAPWRMLAQTILMCCAGWVLIPHNDAWKDMWPEQSAWFACIMASVAWNTAWMEDLLERGGSRWGLWVLVASLSSVLVLAGACYGTMAQWVLSLVAITAAIAFLALFRDSPAIASIVPMVCLALATMVVWTRFRGSLKPLWHYGMLFFAPGFIAALDRWTAKLFPAWGRILSAALLSVIPIVIVTIDCMATGQEEW